MLLMQKHMQDYLLVLKKVKAERKELGKGYNVGADDDEDENDLAAEQASK